MWDFQRQIRQEASSSNKKANNKKHRKGSNTSSKEFSKRPRFHLYTPSNAPHEMILEEALNAELIPAQRNKAIPRGVDGNKHCLYHKNIRNTMEECTIFLDKIEELIRTIHLKKYVKTEWEERSPHRKSSFESTCYNSRIINNPLA